MTKKTVKKKAKYAVSRAALKADLDDILDRLSELELGQTTPDDLDAFLSNVSSDLADLSYAITDTDDPL